MCPNEHDGKYIPSCGSKYTYNYCFSLFAVKLFFTSHEQYPGISYTYNYCSSPFAIKLFFTSHEQYPDISYTCNYCLSPLAVKLFFTSHEQYPDKLINFLAVQNLKMALKKANISQHTI